MTVGQLNKGDRFKLWDDSIGCVVEKSGSRVKVVIDGRERVKEFNVKTDGGGVKRVAFVDRKTAARDIAASCEVEKL